jgi:Family of unknown function (DUF6152)
MDIRAYGLGAALAAAIAAPAFAHHSFAMFDAEKIITAKGTVKELEWTNPHSWLRVMVTDPANGKALQWAFEMSSPRTMTGLGMTPDIVKPGDTVTVTYHPLKDGSRGGQFMQALLPNGKMAVRRPGGPNLQPREQE